MRLNFRIGIVLLLASIVFQSSFITLDAFVSDEGIVLVASDDVAKGHLLFVDTNIPLTPTVYLVQGLVFKVFGSHFLVSRALVCLVNALCVVMVFVLSLCMLPTRSAAFAGALAIPLQIWMWPHAQYFSYNQLTILLCLVAIRLAWSIEENPTRKNAFAFGAVLAAGLWTKPNLPVAIGAGTLLYWLTCWGRSALGLACSRPRGFREVWSFGMATIAGIAVASIPMTLYLASVGILDEMIDGVAKITQIYSDSPTGLFPDLFPLFGQLDAVRMSSGLVLPGMLINAFEGIGRDRFYHNLVLYTGWVDLFVRVLYYTPVLMLGATAGLLLQRLRTSTWSPNCEAALLILLTSAVLALTNVSFAALHYITPTLYPVLALATFGYVNLTTGSDSRALRSSVRWGTSAVVLIYLMGSATALYTYLDVDRAPVHTERGTVWIDSTTAVLWNDLLEETDRSMQDGDEIFIVPYFPMFYYLSARDHPSRFVALGPGFPGAEAEDEIIAQLEADEVEFALDVYGAEYPGLEKFQSAYPRLHRYLETHFTLERRFSGPAHDYADLLRRSER